MARRRVEKESRKNNFNISTVHQIKEKPKACPKCGNLDLRSDIVKANLGGHPVNHSYCKKCELLMIIKSHPKYLFDDIKKSVGFIFKIEDKVTPCGTGFFVKVAIENSTNMSAGYFVTAKHVLQDAEGNFFKEIYLRLNRNDGTSDGLVIPLESDKLFVHEEEGVDLVVFPLFLNKDLAFDVKYIDEELISTKEIVANLGIGEGDDVFFTGLFTIFLGQKQNRPICRFGNVSLLPKEKIEWKEVGKKPQFVDLYLLECQSFGGNSGSPVFFKMSSENASANIENKPSQIYLAGIMRGSFNASNELGVSNITEKMFSWENIGIAAVSPAYKLHELLYSEEIKQQRAKI